MNWYDQDETPPVGPPERHVIDSLEDVWDVFAELGAAISRAYATSGRAFGKTLRGLSIIAGHLDEAAKFSAGTHDSGSAFDTRFFDRNKDTHAPHPLRGDCHKTYPNSGSGADHEPVRLRVTNLDRKPPRRHRR